MGLSNDPDFKITTKAEGWKTGAGAKDNVLASAKKSFEELKTDKVSVSDF